jgi:hypothetical protein
MDLGIQQSTQEEFIFLLYAVGMKFVLQGDSGGICNALGNYSMCDSKQKSSYEHSLSDTVFHISNTW